MMAAFHRTISLDPETDQDLIEMIQHAPNASALVRAALRAYRQQPSVSEVLAEVRERLATTQDRPQGAKERPEEPEEALAALDDMLEKFS